MRAACILLYFIHGPPVFSILGPPSTSWKLRSCTLMWPQSANSRSQTWRQRATAACTPRTSWRASTAPICMASSRTCFRSQPTVRSGKSAAGWGIARPVQHYHDLGLFFQVSLPDSNETLCMLNRQRELTLPHLIAAFTATISAYV